MAKDEEIKTESRIVSEDTLPLRLKAKLKSQAQIQANNLEREYRSVLSSGNTEKAIELLIELIYTDDSTPKRREELRGLYSKQCPAGEDPTEYGYLRVMEVRWSVNDNHRNDKPIRGAKEDYKSYIDDLLIQAQNMTTTTTLTKMP